MLELAIDNDVLIKTSLMKAGEHLLHHCCPEGCGGAVVTLVTAKWVTLKRLERLVQDELADTEQLDYLRNMLSLTTELELDDAEVALATQLQEWALVESLGLDTGEAQLAALCALRGAQLVSGDKRAIVALDRAILAFSAMRDLAFKVGCLEQVVATIALHAGGPMVREAICSAGGVDTALRMAMECSRTTVPADYYSSVGLESYIDDLRRNAPLALMPGVSLCSVTKDDGIGGN